MNCKGLNAKRSNHKSIFFMLSKTNLYPQKRRSKHVYWQATYIFTVRYCRTDPISCRIHSYESLQNITLDIFLFHIAHVFVCSLPLVVSPTPSQPQQLLPNSCSIVRLLLYQSDEKENKCVIDRLISISHTIFITSSLVENVGLQ